MGKRGDDVLQEYTEVKVKIGYTFREGMMWGEKTVMEIYRKKTLNLSTRFPSQRRLSVTYFKDAEMFYLNKNNYLPK